MVKLLLEAGANKDVVDYVRPRLVLHGAAAAAGGVGACLGASPESLVARLHPQLQRASRPAAPARRRCRTC